MAPSLNLNSELKRRSSRLFWPLRGALPARQVYDMDKDGSHDDMGKAETSLRALLAAGKEPVKSQRGFSVLETKKSGKVALQPTLLLARGPCATLFTFSILRHPFRLFDTAPPPRARTLLLAHARLRPFPHLSARRSNSQAASSWRRPASCATTLSSTSLKAAGS